MTSHLTTLVSRFLRTLENVKSWNHLDSLKGEAELKHHLCNIIKYTFYLHKQQITEQEVEQLVHLLEKEGKTPAVTLFPKKRNNNPSKRINAEDIVYVRYLDHILFRNTDSALYKPALRETVGWLQKESPEAVWILWERSLEKLPHERSPAKESGLVLLKSDIVEMRRLPLQNFSNWLLCRTSALTSNRRVGASESEAKNSARKKSEEGKNHGNIAKRHG